MQLVVSTKPSSKIDAFNKKKWPLANEEHYGKELNWKRKNFFLTVYDKNRLVLGTLSFKIEAGVAYIGTLLVAQKERGKGIGTKLVQKAENIAVKQKAHKIYLQTGKTWTSADFYRKLGYVSTGELPNHYDHQTFVEFTKFL